MSNSSRKGFTVVELLVVVVLGTLILFASYQVLAINTRVHAVNGARLQGQQTLRGGLEILSGELREISTKGGDLIDFDRGSVTIRGQREFGLVCAVNYGGGSAQLTALRVGRAFAVGDSVFVLHDNDPERATDDEWFGGTVSAVGTSTACGGNPSQVLTLPFVSATAAAFDPDSVRVGAPIRGFDVFTYGQYEVDGEQFLARKARGAANPDLLVGPLPPTGGVAFRYLDAQGKETKKDTLVAQIELTLRYESALRSFDNELVSDSILLKIYPRN
jgi:prepilin-type N-terminal cleavage/methylation domain-containing protein